MWGVCHLIGNNVFFPLAIASNNFGCCRDTWEIFLSCIFSITYLQIPDKYLKQGKKIEQYRTRLQNFDICFCVPFDCYWQIFFLEGRLSSLKYFGNLWGSSNTKFVILSGSVLIVANQTCTKTLKSSKIMWTGYK